MCVRRVAWRGACRLQACAVWHGWESVGEVVCQLTTSSQPASRSNSLGPAHCTSGHQLMVVCCVCLHDHEEAPMPHEEAHAGCAHLQGCLAVLCCLELGLGTLQCRVLRHQLLTRLQQQRNGKGPGNTAALSPHCQSIVTSWSQQCPSLSRDASSADRQQYLHATALTIKTSAPPNLMLAHIPHAMPPSSPAHAHTHV